MLEFARKVKWLGYIGNIVFIFTSTIIYALPAEDVEIINDRDYSPRVHELLQGAKKSIYLVMFSIHYYDRYPDSPSNILLRDLAGARKRGVDVRVILEDEQEPGRVIKFLKQNKIAFKVDPPDITTHAKLIIIDGTYIVIGSTNWSYSALSKNNETAVVIKSQEVARVYVSYFNKNLDYIGN